MIAHHFFFLKPIYIPRALNTGTCFPQGDILLCGPTQEPVLTTASTGNTRKNFWKNAGEWTRTVEISMEEIPGSKRSMHGKYTDLLQALKGQLLSSVFSSDGTLISASAAPHCGGGSWVLTSCQPRMVILRWDKGDKSKFLIKWEEEKKKEKKEETRKPKRKKDRQTNTNQLKRRLKKERKKESKIGKKRERKCFIPNCSLFERKRILAAGRCKGKKNTQTANVIACGKLFPLPC